MLQIRCQNLQYRCVLHTVITVGVQILILDLYLVQYSPLPRFVPQIHFITQFCIFGLLTRCDILVRCLGAQARSSRGHGSSGQLSGPGPGR